MRGRQHQEALQLLAATATRREQVHTQLAAGQAAAARYTAQQRELSGKVEALQAEQQRLKQQFRDLDLGLVWDPEQRGKEQAGSGRLGVRRGQGEGEVNGALQGEGQGGRDVQACCVPSALSAGDLKALRAEVRVLQAERAMLQEQGDKVRVSGTNLCCS